MEKTERETHDFMNVESFSQLPFIRPAPVKEKGIRLFGIEFGGSGDTTAATDESESAESVARGGEEANKDSSENGESSRKFECHYCCRNFPTSQALGGHQNAHKRERQHAKRAHLQSAMVHYGHVNMPTTITYPSWSSSASTTATTNYANSNYTPATARFYASHGTGTSSYAHHHHHHPVPINGSPMGVWRIPPVQSSAAFNRDRTMHRPLPLFGNDELKPSSSPVMGSSQSRSRHVYEAKPGLQDHVSLDLRL